MKREQIRVIPLQAVVRHKGYAQADGGQIQEQIIAAQLEFRDQVQLVLLKRLWRNSLVVLFRVSMRSG